jgi:hypothetical protein
MYEGPISTVSSTQNTRKQWEMDLPLPAHKLPKCDHGAVRATGASNVLSSCRRELYNPPGNAMKLEAPASAALALWHKIIEITKISR